MSWRTAHGSGGSALVRVETSPADELPVGLPADAGEVSRADHGHAGRFAGGNKVSARGGRAKAGKTKLAVRIGLSKLAEGSDFGPYKRSAVGFRKAHCGELARLVGGGVCGPGPSSIVATAALALAWSRYLSDRAQASGDADLAGKAIRFGDQSRQMLLTAHELCAREAVARKAARPEEDVMDRITRENREDDERLARLAKNE